MITFDRNRTATLAAATALCVAAAGPADALSIRMLDSAGQVDVADSLHARAEQDGKSSGSRARKSPPPPVRRDTVTNTPRPG